MTIGTINPAMVPMPLDRPIRIDAYRGAMSKWLTLYPDIAKPLHATPRVSSIVAMYWKMNTMVKIRVKKKN